MCLERGADLHLAQLMPLTVSCFSKIQIGFTFLVPAHPGSPGKTAVKRVCVCVCFMGYISALAYYLLLVITGRSNADVSCRYPLLLNRLLKLTPHEHEDRADIIQARKYVEETLSVINAV